MIRTAKKLAACVLMLGVLACGTALSAAAQTASFFAVDFIVSVPLWVI